ncbi:MAG: copper amine oxidase N-terminal domain-containing protein [Syntrophomonadaceae bacterium]|jgi:hypothetical protein
MRQQKKRRSSLPTLMMGLLLVLTLLLIGAYLQQHRPDAPASSGNVPTTPDDNAPNDHFGISSHILQEQLSQLWNLQFSPPQTSQSYTLSRGTGAVNEQLQIKCEIYEQQAAIAWIELNADFKTIAPDSLDQACHYFKSTAALVGNSQDAEQFMIWLSSRISGLQLAPLNDAVIVGKNKYTLAVSGSDLNLIITPAPPPPVIYLNGQRLHFDVNPIIEDGRTLVPLRAIFEAMGATVTWNDATATATAVKGNTRVVLPVGSTTPTINGIIFKLDVPARIVEGRTLAPLRFVGEAFGGRVTWDGGTNLITITTDTADKTAP